MEPTVAQDHCPRPVPGQVGAEPQLVDEVDGVMVGLEQVVVELLEPRPVVPARAEAGGKPSRDRLALKDGDSVAALREAQGGGQPQGAPTENGHPTGCHQLRAVDRIFTARMLASRGWPAAKP